MPLEDRKATAPLLAEACGLEPREDLRLPAVGVGAKRHGTEKA